MNSNSQTTNELSCCLCKTSHGSEWELKEHLWSLLHHVKLEQKEKNTLHQCVLCLTSTANLVDYGRHLNDQKHKQALEKAKEKKKSKPKASSSRHGLSKIAKQKSKKSLKPNPNWHLSSYNPHKQEHSKITKMQAQFGNWKARDDWHWKGNKKINPKMQSSDTQFNNKQYWNNHGGVVNNNNNNNSNSNNRGFHWFNSSNKNPYERWNIPSHLANGVVMEADQLNPSNKSKNNRNAVQPLMSKKLVILSNHQNLKRNLSPKRMPPLATKNSKSSTDSNGYAEGQYIPLETSSIKSSSKVADNFKNATLKPERIHKSKILSQTALASAKPKDNTSSQVSKISMNVSKLKSKGEIVKSAVNKETEKLSQKPLFTIDKVGTKNVTDDKCSAEISKNNPSRKKFIGASVKNKSDNFASVDKTKPSPSLKKKSPLKNSRLIEKQQIAAESKTKHCNIVNPAEKKDSLFGSDDSDVKISGSVNSQNEAIGSLKRSFNSTNAQKLLSSSNPNKKLKTLPKSDITESRKKITKTDSLNVLPVTNSSEKQKTLLNTNSSNPNDRCKKAELSVLSALNPTEEQKTLSPLLHLEQNENGFKVNDELVTKLRKKLIGHDLMTLSNSNTELKTSSHENTVHSKDESAPAVKHAAINVRQEELVKMMKLPRLSRKEKMHLSSLLQSYTKSQNKKLAVPRLTMQLSGLYDSSSSSTDITSVAEMAELPEGMEEQITYLIKRENLEALSVNSNANHQKPRLSTRSKKTNLQTAKEKDFPISVTESVGHKTVTGNSGRLSPHDLSNIQIEKLNSQCLSDVTSTPVETCSSQVGNIVREESINISRRESNALNEPTSNILREKNIQLENSSSSCTTLANLPETSLQTNSGDPETTGTQSGSSENIPTSNDNNTENVFSKVYLLTLREEQIRSSIVDMNEKMNYLRKLIEDSQMALQGCCIEHKRLLEEESTIRNQRLQILQNAMNGKGSCMDTINPSPSQQTSPSQSMSLSVPSSQLESTLPQTDLGQHWSSVSMQQPSITTQTQSNNPTVQPSNYFCGMSREISPVNRSDHQSQDSSPPSSLNHSSNLSTLQSQVPSTSVSPEKLASEPLIPSVCGNKSSRLNQNNRISPPLNGSDVTSSDKGFSENRNTATNSHANTNQRKESPLQLGHITIKQEIPSPPPPTTLPLPPSPQINIEQTPSTSRNFVPNNIYNSGIPNLKTFSEEATFSDGKQTESTVPDNVAEPDRLSGNVRTGLPLAARENKAMNFEIVQIKKEPPSPPQKESEEPFVDDQLQSRDNSKEHQVESQQKIKSIFSLFAKKHKENQLSDDDDDDDETPKVSSERQVINITAEQDPCSPQGKTPDTQSVTDLESVQIKKEPLTPPPHSQVDSEETFFVPRLPSAADQKENPDPSALNQTKSQTEIVRTNENNCSISSAKNLSVSDDQNDPTTNPGGMSMTYLGSMPNNFLEQLTLSWKKQNMSATMNERSGLNNQHSFSDSESTICSFIKKSTPKISVPARMNPRVCLEPLNMKYHRKRTLSEPVSTSDSSSLLVGNLQQDGFQKEKKDPEKLSSLKKFMGKKETNSNDESYFVKEEEYESVEAKQQDLRSGSHEKESDDSTDLSVGKNESVSHLDDPFLNNKLMDLDSSDPDDPKESKHCNIMAEEDSSMTSRSDNKQNNSVGSLNDPQLTGAVSPDLKFPTDPLNILNNLNLLQVVRTKKFPRTDVNRSQLPTYKGADNPVNGLYIFENHLYASYQGNSPYKFSLHSGRCLQIYNCKTYNVQCMLVCRISRNKTRLFSGGASEVLLVFDEVTGVIDSLIDTGRKIYSLHENWGSLFVGLADGGVTKINLKSLRKTSELSYGSKPINCLATCTEGAQKLLCVGAYDASILIVDAMTGLLLKTLNCYHRILYAIKVHHHLIFSCSSDKTLQVHDVTSGKLLHCLQDHTSTISCLHVEDNLLVTGSHDKRINIYNSSNPREAPLIFYTTSKEPISCLTVHDKVVYCGNFFGHIEAIQFEAAQKWICKYDSCELVFGQRKGLFYHLVNQHLQMTGLAKKKCLWENCGEYIYSVLDITEHFENHINQIVLSDWNGYPFLFRREGWHLYRDTHTHTHTDIYIYIYIYIYII